MLHLIKPHEGKPEPQLMGAGDVKDGGEFMVTTECGTVLLLRKTAYLIPTSPNLERSTRYRIKYEEENPDSYDCFGVYHGEKLYFRLKPQCPVLFLGEHSPAEAWPREQWPVPPSRGGGGSGERG